MKRAARHGVYIDEPNIIDAQFDAGMCRDEFYIKIHKKVAASYHNKTNKNFTIQRPFLRRQIYWQRVVTVSQELIQIAHVVWLVLIQMRW